MANKKLKNQKFNVLRWWIFSVQGRRDLLWHGSLRINVLQVLKKKKTVQNVLGLD
jgi:hypothetical protein